MILVVGATGYMGRETVKQLLAKGIPVRAMTRTPEKAADLKELGAEVVQGDLIDPPSLARACQGAEVVIAAAHQLLGAGKYSSNAVDNVGHRALIDAAKAAGVKRFVYTSMVGASPDHPVDFNRTKYAIEQYLIHSGLEYTILRGTAFMEWHAHNFLGKEILEKGKVTLLGKGESPTNFIAARDIAYYAVLAATDPRLCNRVIEVGGPGNPTKNQVAQMYMRLSGKSASVSHLPRPMLKVMSVIMKPFQPVLSRVMLFSYEADKNNNAFDCGPLVQEFPHRMTTMDEFIKEKVAESQPA